MAYQFIRKLDYFFNFNCVFAYCFDVEKQHKDITEFISDSKEQN